MSAELERVKRIIRGLQEKTQDRGATEAEAMESAAKIGQLLEQYDLDISEVSVREEKCRLQEVFAPDLSMGTVVTGIARLCGLMVYHKTGAEVPTYVMFGMERDVEIAVYLYEVCAEAAEVGWTARIAAGHGFKRASRDAFRAGFGSRVHTRMRELAEHREAAQAARVVASGCRDLVLVREQIVADEWEKQGVKLGKAKSHVIRDVGSYYAGQEHGDTVNINSPLDHQERAAISG